MRGAYSIPPTRAELGLHAQLAAQDIIVAALRKRIAELQLQLGREILRREDLLEDAMAWRRRQQQARERHKHKHALRKANGHAKITSNGISDTGGAL